MNKPEITLPCLSCSGCLKYAIVHEDIVIDCAGISTYTPKSCPLRQKDINEVNYVIR